MIVRFLDRKGRCCQIATPEIPILVYMTADEKKKLLSSNESQCLMLIDNRLDSKTQEQIVQKLNTKTDPLEMNNEKNKNL